MHYIVRLIFLLLENSNFHAVKLRYSTGFFISYTFQLGNFSKLLLEMSGFPFFEEISKWLK